MKKIKRLDNYIEILQDDLENFLNENEKLNFIFNFSKYLTVSVHRKNKKVQYVYWKMANRNTKAGKHLWYQNETYKPGRVSKEVRERIIEDYQDRFCKADSFFAENMDLRNNFAKKKMKALAILRNTPSLDSIKQSLKMSKVVTPQKLKAELALKKVDEFKDCMSYIANEYEAINDNKQEFTYIISANRVLLLRPERRNGNIYAMYWGFIRRLDQKVYWFDERFKPGELPAKYKRKISKADKASFKYIDNRLKILTKLHRKLTSSKRGLLNIENSLPSLEKLKQESYELRKKYSN